MWKLVEMYIFDNDRFFILLTNWLPVIGLITVTIQVKLIQVSLSSLGCSGQVSTQTSEKWVIGEVQSTQNHKNTNILLREPNINKIQNFKYLEYSYRILQGGMNVIEVSALIFSRKSTTWTGQRSGFWVVFDYKRHRGVKCPLYCL